MKTRRLEICLNYVGFGNGPTVIHYAGLFAKQAAENGQNASQIHWVFPNPHFLLFFAHVIRNNCFLCNSEAFNDNGENSSAPIVASHSAELKLSSCFFCNCLFLMCRGQKESLFHCRWNKMSTVCFGRLKGKKGIVMHVCISKGREKKKNLGACTARSPLSSGFLFCTACVHVFVVCCDWNARQLPTASHLLIRRQKAGAAFTESLASLWSRNLTLLATKGRRGHRCQGPFP